MKKPKKPKTQGPETGVPPDNHNGIGTPNRGRCCPRWPGAPNVQRNDKFIEQIRQIIADTPEVRAEKVEPLLEAVASGTYEIDARTLAHRLIAELILKR